MLHGWISNWSSNLLLVRELQSVHLMVVYLVFAMNKVLPFFITLLIAGAISAALIVLVTKPQEEA